MHDRAYAIATGAFIVVALAVLSVTAYWLAGADQQRRPYVVVSSYSVAGLSEGSQVLYRGVPAGRVETIGIDPQEPSQVLVLINVNPDIPVQRSTVARLNQRGLTGVAQIELEDAADSDVPLKTSEADPARIPMRPGLLDQVTDAGTEALVLFEDLVATLNEALDEENREQLRSIGQRLDRTLESVESIAATLEAELPATLESTRRAADSVAALAESATESIEDVEALVADLRAMAATAQRFADDLAETGISGIATAAAAVDEAAREIARFAEELAREPSQLLRGRRTQPGPGEEE